MTDGKFVVVGMQQYLDVNVRFIYLALFSLIEFYLLFPNMKKALIYKLVKVEIEILWKS